MAERYRSIFLAILSLTIIWVIVVLLYLPKSDNIAEYWTASTSDLLISTTSQVPDESQTGEPIKILETRSRYVKKRRRSHIVENYSPHQIDLVRYFQSPIHKILDSEETLFYDFDPVAGLVDEQELERLDKNKHDIDTLKYGIIKNPTDEFVKSQGDELFAFNLLVSNRIGIFRPLPDSRNKKCLDHVIGEGISSSTILSTHNASSYNTKTPVTISGSGDVVIEKKLKASIIICYYNEAPSALLRTIHTVLKRSPNPLLEEIIIIDDSSSKEFHYEKICKPFISSNLVVFTRTSRREGLIRARLLGARMAKGDVIIFLDSHVEANVGWLEPLLEVIQKNKTTIAVPMIDLINAETLIYSASPMVKGGLNWALNFKWDSVPSERLRTYDDFIKPIESPTMAGGLYAIHRDFFVQLGEYDPEMELWGGENVEMSLRTWMCGGRILILPCSRLGHIFRKRRPYGPEPDQPDSLLFNSYRTALIWLGDDYIHKFYEAQPLASSLSVGDISRRLEIKERLSCQNFSWFLDNIYPSLKKDLAPGEIKQAARENVDENRSKKSVRFEQAIPSTRNQIDNVININHVTHVTNRRAQRQVSPFFNHRLIAKTKSHQLASNYKSKIYKKSKAFQQLPMKPKSPGNPLYQHPKTIGQFQIQAFGSDYCIESKGGYLAKSFTRLILNHCLKVEEYLVNQSSTSLMANANQVVERLNNQLWKETELGDFRLGDDQCLDLIKNLPLLRKCHNMGSFQVWKTSSQPESKIHNSSLFNTNIYNSVGGLCLGVERVQAGEPIIVTICDTSVEIEGGNKMTKYLSGHNPEKVYPNWYTSSSFTTLDRLRFRSNKKNLTLLKLSQKWNLVFVGKLAETHTSTSTSTTSQLTSANQASATTTTIPASSNVTSTTPNFRTIDNAGLPALY